MVRFIPEGALEDEQRRTRPVEVVYLILAENPHGGEDIAGFHHPGHGWVPLVVTGDGPYETILAMARRMVGSPGVGTLRLVRFTGREVLHELR